MADVKVTDHALRQIEALPLPIQGRLDSIVDRLAHWPEVSGAKPLKGEWKGHYRIRTGDYRVVFTARRGTVTIVRVDHRKDVYED